MRYCADVHQCCAIWIGVRWLMSLLYPQQFPDDLREVTRDFYKRFYQVDLTQQQVDGLLASATASKK